MSAAQSKVWRFVRTFRKRRGYPPSTPAIAKHLGVSKQCVSQTITRLVRDGHLRKVDDVGSWIEVKS